jgi:glycosyltransferase involved in cell wall biosynthesis
VLFVGRLLHDKGISEFVDCARRCHDAMPGALRFTAAGEPDSGNPASVEPAILARWREEGAVHFAGHVDDMPALLARADIVVLPSYGEGAPRSLIEAAACAKPLVATDVRGCRDVVVDGVNGLLVPVRNSKRLAEAVMTLADDAPLRARMGEAGRRHVLATLDEQIVFRETYRTYEELVAGAPRSKPASPSTPRPAFESAEGPATVTLAFPERRRSLLEGLAAPADQGATGAADWGGSRASDDKESDRRAA